MDFGISPDDAMREFGLNAPDLSMGTTFELDSARAAPQAVDLETALRSLNDYAADPARGYHYVNLLRALAPDFLALLLSDAKDRQACPLPAFAAIKHLQTSLFDNWREFNFVQPKGKKKGARKHRFNVQLEVWTGASSPMHLNDKNRTFNAYGPVLDASNLSERLDTIPAFKSPRGAWIEYREWLESLVSSGNMVAPLYGMTKGNAGYMLNHVLLLPEPQDVLTHSRELKCVLSTPHGGLGITHFENFCANKPNVPLAGNAVLSSRLSVDSTNAWRTGTLSLDL